MDEALFKQLITLYLIYHFYHLRSAYNLVKILARKFGIIDLGQIMKDLKKKKYATEKILSQMNYYAITTEGETFLEVNLSQLLSELKEKYLPNDKEYIEAIMSRSQ